MPVILALIAGALVLYAFASLALEMRFGRRNKMAGGKGRERVAALALGVVLLAFAAAADLVDEKVPDGRRPPSPAFSGSSDYFASNLPSFRPGPRLWTGSLTRDLCLVRYYPRRPGRDPGANWWTTCQMDQRLKSISDVRSKLALPKAWGLRNARVVADIPAGQNVVYMGGTAASQCEPNRGTCYPGGGVQLLFRDQDFDRAWFVRYECTSGPEKAPKRFVACTG